MNVVLWESVHYVMDAFMTPLWQCLIILMMQTQTPIHQPGRLDRWMSFIHLCFINGMAAMTDMNRAFGTVELGMACSREAACCTEEGIMRLCAPEAQRVVMEESSNQLFHCCSIL